MFVVIKWDKWRRDCTLQVISCDPPACNFFFFLLSFQRDRCSFTWGNIEFHFIHSLILFYLFFKVENIFLDFRWPRIGIRDRDREFRSRCVSTLLKCRLVTISQFISLLCTIFLKKKKKKLEGIINLLMGHYFFWREFLFSLAKIYHFRYAHLALITIHGPGPCFVCLIQRAW